MQLVHKSYPLLGAATLGLVCLTAPHQAHAAVTITDTFQGTGANQVFLVPTGVTSLSVELWGAGGGANYLTGGGGAFVSGDLVVTSGELLDVIVGTAGTTSYENNSVSYPGIGGYGGGGDSPGGSGGGGRSALSFAGTDLVDAAGGGGGSVDGAGGAGGVTSGASSTGGYYPYGGTGASQSGGGSGGTNYTTDGATGTMYQGGSGGYELIAPNTPYGGGGGGGGGYYGGGGGGYDSGGGGGSSFTANLTNFTGQDGSGATAGGTTATGYETNVGEGGGFYTGNAGSGLVIISYQASPTPEPSQIGVLALISLSLGALLLKARRSRMA